MLEHDVRGEPLMLEHDVRREPVMLEHDAREMTQIDSSLNHV